MTTDDHEPVLRRAPAERERLAEVIADRLDGQVIFLALPFLRFARIVARLRLRPIVRAGRVVSSTVRGTRIAGRELTSRAAWLLTVTVIVVLTSSQLLYEFAGYTSYAVALHDAAYATVTGEPLSAETGLARVMELVLATYSVVVFAALAGMLGAYFVQSRGAEAHDGGALDVGATAAVAPPGGRRRGARPAPPSGDGG